MNNSYILCLFVGFGIGFLVTLLPPLQKREQKQKGFDTPQAMITSGVNDIKSDDVFESAESFGQRGRR